MSRSERRYTAHVNRANAQQSTPAPMQLVDQNATPTVNAAAPDARSPAASSFATSGEDVACGHPWTWPPRAASTAPSTSSASSNVKSAPDVATAPHARRNWWAAIERAWFDPTAEPLERRARRAGWTPDDHESYCPRCGRDVGAYEVQEFTCAHCRGSRLPWSRFVRLGSYADPLSTWICEVKFTRWRVLGLELGRMLGRRLREAGFPAHLGPKDAAVVPVPTTWRRVMARGIDHAGVLARGVAAELHIPVLRPLFRTHRSSQRAVPLSERARNVSGSIFARSRVAHEGKTLILVDDVMTSGATLRACARTLRDSRKGDSDGFRAKETIWAAVLAVTPQTDRIPFSAEKSPIAEPSAGVAGGPGYPQPNQKTTWP